MNRHVPQPESQSHGLTRWVSEHGSAVRGFLRASVRNADLADDLLQEVFYRAWEARNTYAETGSERAYLLRIADRLVCDKFRRTRLEADFARQQWLETSPVERKPGPYELAVRSETEEQLAAALEMLTPIQRRILLLRYYGNIPFQEIAETVAVPMNTALSHCRRGLLALRQLLKEESL